MTEKDIQLLIKDLCGRFPYNPNVQMVYLDDYCEPWNTFCQQIYCAQWLSGRLPTSHPVIFKPYLHPLSSMTEEERKEYQYITERWMYDTEYSIADSIDWLNAHHFDYRGLIEKGLALEAPEGMYNFEK